MKCIFARNWINSICFILNITHLANEKKRKQRKLDHMCSGNNLVQDEMNMLLWVFLIVYLCESSLTPVSSAHTSRRSCDSDCSDGEEDFYYTEIKLNTDSVADGLSSLSPASPSVLSPPPPPPSPLPPLSQPPDSHRPPPPSNTKEPHVGGTTPLSRSAPSALYLIHTDHAYQVSLLMPLQTDKFPVF